MKAIKIIFWLILMMVNSVIIFIDKTFALYIIFYQLLFYSFCYYVFLNFNNSTEPRNIITSYGKFPSMIHYEKYWKNKVKEATKNGGKK